MPTKVLVSKNEVTAPLDGKDGAVRLTKQLEIGTQLVYGVVGMYGVVTLIILVHWAVATCLYPIDADAITDRSLKMFEGISNKFMIFCPISIIVSLISGRQLNTETVGKIE